MLTNQILALVILLLLSGFFSSAETALFSISKTRARHLAKTGGKPCRLILRMKKDPHRLLSTILIGNNVVNVGASALATSLAFKTFPGYAVGLATGIMTFLILVFGEVFPKSLATRNNIAIAKLAIFPIFWLSRLFFPIIIFLNFIPRLTGKIETTPSITEEELMTFVEVVEEEGEIKEEEKELIHNIFEFDDTYASEIMTPRADMFVIDANQKPDLKRIVQSGFSRIPIFDESIDDIIGIVNIKELFMTYIGAEHTKDIDVRTIMSAPYFVPENKKLDNLMQQFKKRKNHIAIVIDEHGGVSGLITLEDVLEEIVGEISDETDRDEPHVVKLKPNEWMVLGKTSIDEMNETIPIDIPDVRDYDTFSGYILHKTGKIPEEKEQITIDEYLITVKERDGNRIKALIVQKKHAPATPKIAPTAEEHIHP